MVRGREDGGRNPRPRPPDASVPDRHARHGPYVASASGTHRRGPLRRRPSGNAGGPVSAFRGGGGKDRLPLAPAGKRGSSEGPRNPAAGRRFGVAGRAAGGSGGG